MAKYRSYLRTTENCWKELSGCLSSHFDTQVMAEHVFNRSDSDNDWVYVKLKGYLNDDQRRTLLDQVEGANMATYFYAGYDGWHTAVKTQKQREAALEQS